MEYIEERIVIHRRFYIDPKNAKRILYNPKLLTAGKGYIYSELTKDEKMYIHGIEDIERFKIPEDITLLEILNAVLDFYKITEIEILSSTRKKEVIRAKAMFCYVSKELKFNEQEIQEYLNVGRCTIYHHYKKYKNFLRFDRKLKLELDGLMETIKR